MSSASILGMLSQPLTKSSPHLIIAPREKVLTIPPWLEEKAEAQRAEVPHPAVQLQAAGAGFEPGAAGLQA